MDVTAAGVAAGRSRGVTARVVGLCLLVLAATATFTLSARVAGADPALAVGAGP